jgi:hypothetical protein
VNSRVTIIYNLLCALSTNRASSGAFYAGDLLSENETNNSESTETANLPDIVRRVGGDLEKVISNLPAYVDERFPLDRFKQIALGRLVEAKPELNNENDIAKIVDLLTFHGIDRDQMNDLNVLLDTYGTDDVWTAINYLYEIGLRDRGVASEDESNTNAFVFVRAVLSRIRELRESGKRVVNEEVLDATVWDINEYIDEADLDNYQYTGGTLGGEDVLEVEEDE